MLQNNDWISDAAGADKRKIKKVAAEFQELKTDDCMTEAKNKDNTSLDSSKKTFKRGGEYRESNSDSSRETLEKGKRDLEVFPQAHKNEVRST